MKASCRFLSWSLPVLALLASPALAGAAAAQAEGTSAAVPGWQELVESLRTLPDRMLAKLPEAQRRDPQIRQEVARLALESLASQTLSAIGADGDAPQFLPSIGQVLNIGQPNADTIYRSAALTPGGTYRIRGVRGSLNRAVVAQIVPAQAIRDHLEFADLKVDGEGRFDVLLSAERPAGYTGDWWQLNPATTMLMLRLVSQDWGKEADPTLAIERVDRPIGRPRVDAGALETRLRKLPGQVDFLALMFVDNHEKLRAAGYINKVKQLKLDFGALAGQFYYEGAYELADDEALIVESPLPVKCDYRSIILTNEIYETVDWYNNHSSLNAAQAPADPDGKLRIVVSARDPGARNWLDTAGHPRGIIQGRWTGCDSQPVPVLKKVKVTEVLRHLPKGSQTVTAAQRQDILRERRRALLERRLW